MVRVDSSYLLKMKDPSGLNLPPLRIQTKIKAKEGKLPPSNSINMAKKSLDLAKKYPTPRIAPRINAATSERGNWIKNGRKNDKERSINQSDAEKLIAKTHLHLQRKGITHVATLEEIDVSGNHLEDIAALSPLKNLKILKAAYNKLQKLEDVSTTLFDLSKLISLDLRGNPLTSLRKYQLTLIKKGPKTLDYLDDCDIFPARRLIFQKIPALQGQKKKKIKDHPNDQKQLFIEGPKNYGRFYFKGAIIQESYPAATSAKFILGALHRPGYEEFLHERQRKIMEKKDEGISAPFVTSSNTPLQSEGNEDPEESVSTLNDSKSP